LEVKMFNNNITYNVPDRFKEKNLEEEERKHFYWEHHTKGIPIEVKVVKNEVNEIWNEWCRPHMLKGMEYNLIVTDKYGKVINTLDHSENVYSVNMESGTIKECGCPYYEYKIVEEFTE